MAMTLSTQLMKVQQLVEQHSAKPLRADDIARLLDVDHNEAGVVLRLLWRARRLKCTSDGAWVIARETAVSSAR
jgi:hypothetical protein